MPSDVTVDLGPFSRLTHAIHAVNGPFHQAMLRWAVRYRSFLQKRFVRLSSGAGEWPKLKHKRKRGKLNGAKVLRDTGTLLAAMSPVFSNTPGQLQKRIRRGIRVGYGGPAKHSGSDVSVARIAKWHQTGAGRLPVRRIIVHPSPRLRKQMMGDLRKAASEI